jgi:hypothetical protein
MAKIDKDTYILEEKNKFNYILWFFFGIIAFITIYFPFFGSNLRYQTGATFSGIFNTLGEICNYMGTILCIWGLFLFCRGRLGGLVVLLSGYLLLTFGGWLIDPRSIFGISTAPGYH